MSFIWSNLLIFLVLVPLLFLVYITFSLHDALPIYRKSVV